MATRILCCEPQAEGAAATACRSGAPASDCKPPYVRNLVSLHACGHRLHTHTHNHTHTQHNHQYPALMPRLSASQRALPLKVAPRIRGHRQQGVKKPRVRMFRPKQCALDTTQQLDLRRARLQGAHFEETDGHGPRRDAVGPACLPPLVRQALKSRHMRAPTAARTTLTASFRPASCPVCADTRPPLPPLRPFRLQAGGGSAAIIGPHASSPRAHRASRTCTPTRL